MNIPPSFPVAWIHRSTVALVSVLVSWAVVDARVAHHALIVKQRIKQARRCESRESHIANIFARNPCTVAMNALYRVHKTMLARQCAAKPADNDVFTAVAQLTVQILANRARKFVHGNLLVYGA